MDTKAKRVLLLAESPYFGGITAHLLSILDAFARSEDIECVMATFPGRRGDNTLIDLAQSRGVSVHVLPMTGRFDIRVLRVLRNFVDEQRIDLVHTHNYRATLLCAWAKLDVPIVNTCHGMAVAPTWRIRFWQWAEFRAMRRHALTVACSEYVWRRLVAQGLSVDHVRTVRNSFMPPVRGVAEAPADNVPEATRAALAIPAQAFVALFVGRLVHGKGVASLLDAAAQVPDCAVVIVGDGPLRTSLEKQAETLGIHARFIGYVRQPAPWYALADVVVLPSEMEALPLALIEAAAYGKPAIATRVGGIPEVVSDGHSGILIEPHETEELRVALDRCRDEDLRSEMGRAARGMWEEYFTPRRMNRELTDVYLEALQVRIPRLHE